MAYKGRVHFGFDVLVLGLNYNSGVNVVFFFFFFKDCREVMEGDLMNVSDNFMVWGEVEHSE